MIKDLDEKTIAKLKEIANRSLNSRIKVTDEILNGSGITTPADAYNKGLDDGETILARYILHTMRIYWEKTRNIKNERVSDNF